MMWFYSWTGRRAALAGLIIATLLIVMLPLRLALGWSGLAQRGFSARLVENPVWAGRIQDLAIGPVAVGDVYARLEFWPLLIGHARFAVSRPALGGDPAVAGNIGASWGGISVRDLSMIAPAERLVPALPLGDLQVENVSVRFAGGQCAQASGRVRVMVGEVVPGVDWTGGFLGTPRCERGALLLPLASQSGLDKLTIRIAADGRYSARFSMVADDTMSAEILRRRGFRGSGDRLMMATEGRF